MQEENVRLLLDYLKELRALSGSGYKASKEITEVIGKIRKELGFNGDVEVTTLLADDEVVVVEKVEAAIPLLTIELGRLDEVPRIHYKGEEIELKTSIDFYWGTAGSLRSDSECGFSIARYLKDGNEIPSVSIIQEEL